MPARSLVLGSAFVALLTIQHQARADMVVVESNVASHMVGARLPDRVPVVLPQCGHVTVRMPSGEINVLTGAISSNCPLNRTPAVQVNRQQGREDEAPVRDQAAVQ